MILGIIAGVAAALPAPAPAPCHTDACTMRTVERPHHRLLSRIAACETRGVRHPWRAATGNGFYGGLQFTPTSWRDVGGHGLPHHATELEQRYRGVRLLHRQGIRAWPVCGPPALRAVTAHH